MFIVISILFTWNIGKVVTKPRMHKIIMTVIVILCEGIPLIFTFVMAVVVGKPISRMDCNEFPDNGDTAKFLGSIYQNVKPPKDNKFEWEDPDKTVCKEFYAIWSFSIILCFLYVFSIATFGFIYYRRSKGSTGGGSPGGEMGVVPPSATPSAPPPAPPPAPDGQAAGGEGGGT